MDKIELEIKALSSSQAQAGSYALVLGEKNGNRRLPIIIGMFEAQSIAIELEEITPKRPMTHDLFRSFADNFDINLEEVYIFDLKEGVFYAKIIASNGFKTVEIDSRPSDAIAIGIRFGISIYTTERILSEAGIVLTDLEHEPEAPKPQRTVAPQKASSLEEQIKNETSDKLTEMLNQALANEDYERAAIIRDELNKRN